MSQRNDVGGLVQFRNEVRTTPGLPFSEVLPGAQIEAVLTQLGTTFRDRVFSPVVTLWTFLSQVLSADHSCRDAVARLLAWRTAQGWKACSSDTSSYCAARRRLPLGLLQNLVRQTGQLAAAATDPAWLWKGRHVKVVDGSTLTMPDSPANRQAYPRARQCGRAVGFPLVRVVVLFSLAWGTAFDLALGSTRGKHTGETTLFRSLWDRLEPNDIVLGDRLFDAYRHAAGLKQRGVDVVLRMNGSRHCDFRRGRRLGVTDHAVTWKRPTFNPRRFDRASYDALPEQIDIRELRYTVDTPGFRAREIVLVTTLCDAEAYPKDDLADLYLQRWHAEVDFNALKTTLQMEHLRCQSPAQVEKEIWAHLLAYNLLRRVLAEAARTHDVLPRELSFKAAMQTVNAFAPYLSQAADPAALWQTLLEALASNRVGDRPGRVEPRKLKRRVGKYPYLTAPRNQERAKACA
jgi:hypothetical protein